MCIKSVWKWGESNVVVTAIAFAAVLMTVLGLNFGEEMKVQAHSLHVHDCAP